MNATKLLIKQFSNGSWHYWTANLQYGTASVSKKTSITNSNRVTYYCL